MNILRGDVFTARFPHSAGGRGKKRPVIVVQADAYNLRLRHAVVVQVTSNLDEKEDPACLFIEASTPAGVATGLKQDSVALGYMLSLISEDRFSERIGSLPKEFLERLDACLKCAIGIG